MRCELTTDSGASRLILIFAGWGTDASFYSHISIEGYDTMVVSDYSRLDFPLHLLDSYHTVCLFAWSLGVYAAAATLPFEKLAMAIAVNGTENPVDDSFGIPVAIYNGTEQSLNERNLMKFRHRMAGEAYTGIKERFPDIGVKELREQLAEIRRHSLSRRRQGAPSNACRGKWNRVYISENDAIFPAANQTRAWESHPCRPEIMHLDAPHYIDIANVVKGAIPSYPKVGERFRRALATYDGNAAAQKTIANRLLKLMPEKRIGKALEIGPGSGLFTSLFSERFNPEEIDYIDLYPLPEYKAAAVENYHIAEAEAWMETEAGCRQSEYDAIVSASAIQWFIDPARFFKNAYKLLKPGGVLACSSFLPGNLYELSAVNPYGLVYRSEDELREMLLSQGFRDTSIESEEILLDFNTSRNVIKHIKDTGVGGSIDTPAGIRTLLDKIPGHLTYRPVYLIAVKSSI